MFDNLDEQIEKTQGTGPTPETMGEMEGTTRWPVSFFMNRFRKCGSPADVRTITLDPPTTRAIMN
jgi:hypothetical protein